MDQIETENQISQLINKVATLEENLGRLEDRITQLERKLDSSSDSSRTWRQI